jgi:hypothetical protein
MLLSAQKYGPRIEILQLASSPKTWGAAQCGTATGANAVNTVQIHGWNTEAKNMNKFPGFRGLLPPLAALLLSTLLAACGGGDGGRDPILGGLALGTTPVVPVVLVAPTVTSVLPLSNATVANNAKILTATFSQAMNPATLNSSFTLACPTGTPITGAVGYIAGTNTATLTLPASPNLPVSTTCTATVSTGAQATNGLALAAAYHWNFVTSATADTTAPTVTSTINANGATGVPTNTKVGATFSEAMDASTLTGSSFVLKQTLASTVVTGTLAYTGLSALFTPATTLIGNTQYTVTIKGGSGGVSDLAGNVLLADYVWSWTTAASGDVTPPTVSATNPLNLALGVCMNKTVNATFSEAMDPTTINNASFTLSISGGGAAVAGLVSYDVPTHIASFNPSGNLTGTTSYTATIKGGTSGVKDLAGNALVADQSIQFTTGVSTCATAPELGAIAPFGGFGGNATLTNDGLNTVVNGDIGVNAASTTITGLRDAGGNVYTVTPSNDGSVTGRIYTLTAPPGSVAGAAVTQARADALVAFNSISPASLPGGIDVSSLAQCPSCGGAGQGPGQLAGRTLPPGIYLSTTGTYGIGITAPTAGNLTLDAAGDANAVWVFQTAAVTGTLTVGVTGPATPATPIQVLLLNGAQTKNVFWYVPAGATIGTGSTMVGTMLSDASITISTTGGSPPTAVLTKLNGRAIALTAAVTMTNTVINVPAP